MSGPLGDGELRAMLDARATRVHPAAARQVMAAVSARLDPPQEGLAVSVRPVSAGRTGARRRAWVPGGVAAAVVLGLAAVVAIAVLPTRPPHAGDASLAPSATTGSATASSPASGPPTVGPSGGHVVLTLADLRAALRSGALADHLVLVDGSIRFRPTPCPSPVPADCQPGLLGLPDVPIRPAAPLTIDSVGDVVRGRLVLRPSDTAALEYLGRVPDPLDRPITVARLLATPSVPPAESLIEVSGWLVVGGIHSCPMLGVGATPCPGPAPWLTDDPPFEDGMLATDQGTSVALDGLPTGRPAGQVVTRGPFLVRRVRGGTQCVEEQGSPAPLCRGGLFLRWQVVAVLAPGVVVEVLVP